MSKTFRDTAEILADARKQQRKIAVLPNPAPQNLAEAYDIQDLLISAMQTPVAGPIFAPAVRSTPAEISAPASAAFIVEAEFAFRIGHDLLPQDGPFQRREILDRVAGLHPAIEIVDTRFEKGFAVGGPWVVADGSANLAFVHGPSVDSWRDINLPEQRVRVLVNGKQTTNGSGAAVLGDPVNVLEWLVNHLHQRGIALKAGDWVSTGNLAEAISIQSGDKCVADFGPHGQVRIGRMLRLHSPTALSR